MTRLHRDLREFTEAELRRRCLPWEVSLLALQALAAACVVTGVLALSNAALPAMLVCLGVAPAVALALGATQALGALRGRLPDAAYRDELEFRAWQRGLSARTGAAKLEGWAAREVTRERPPEWLLVLEGVELPGGGRCWLRVELSAAGSPAAPFRSHLSGRAQLRLGRGLTSRACSLPLQADEVDRLRRVAEASMALPAEPAAPSRGEGLPCALTVARRAPLRVAHRRCDLADSAPVPAELSAALSRLLLAMDRQGKGPD